ncbi:hypothetical protein HDE78_000318 [Rhodanobacter sp. K2T2]|uniref:XVIPCD domain-containing protein n=1 Tax=Rhodanobacter sp. K2T2 TaxID=2723085 RepID=UPI0015C85D23|nr:XVIPCD domain-containing protein [Rhodanobacter sp. K2T2]NYE27393.1 hypothetical protein [Rhodanobacter sp. K2T2]
MTLRTADYAAISNDVYKDPVVDQRAPDGQVLTYRRVELNGVWYQPIAHADNPKTGFQATAYERLDGTHATVIAYRGTEMDREFKQDLLTTDVSMAIKGVNTQGPDADAFTKKVIAQATQKAEQYGYPPSISVTGHSLGGTEAEMNAFKYGLKGETFNAYGAAGLSGLGIPEGGTQVIDHVRATDVVSAASPHFGQVRIYAVPQDIQALQGAGYHDSRLLNAITPDEPILGKIQGEAHKMGNFLPNNSVTGQSLLTPQNEALAAEHSVMIGHYRGQIERAREMAHIEYEIQKPVIDATGAVVHQVENNVKKTGEFLGAVKDKAVEDYHGTVNAASRRIEGAAHSINAHPVLLNHPAHPDYMLFQQSLGAVHRLDAEHGRTPDQYSTNLAAGVAVGAKAHGLSGVDHVVLSIDGANAFAVQGDPASPSREIARPIATAQAVHTPVEQHTQAMQQVNQQQQQVQQQVQQAMQVQQPQQQGPAMGR